MPLPIWPGILPAPLSEGYQVQPQSAIARTDMETGAARTRRLTTSPIDQHTVSIHLRDLWSVEIFRAFWKHKLQEGAAWFQIRLPYGTGFPYVEARFIEPYQLSKQDKFYRLQGRLEVRNPPCMSEAELDAALS